MDYNKCFSLFNSSYIDKEIKKNVLLNNIKNKEDRKIIEKFVENVYLKYCIKADSINKEAEENFSEIEIIEININNYRTIYDIYGILLSIIPYPILAIFKYNDRISFAVSNRIPAEDKNNKGKIYTSYLIKQEDISSYLKIDIDNCENMIEIYNKWISNVENVVAYYERLDRVMETIEIGLHIKSEEVLENLESYIAKYCGTYNMKPKDGWKSKLEKYSDSPLFIKKVETHLLWEYLSENAFFKNKLEDFLSWNDFKEDCVYNHSTNDIYYSQYNSRMSDNDEIDDIYENRKNNNRYKSHNANIKVEIIKNESEGNEKSNNIDNTIQETFEAFEEYNSAEYERASEEIEKDFMLYAIKIDYNVLYYASDKLLNDKEFMLQAIEQNILCIGWANEELLNDEYFMLQAIEKNILCIGWASDGLKNNKEFMQKAIEKDDFCIAYASNELKNNEEFMLQAIKKNSSCIGYASNELLSDKDFMLEVIKNDSKYINFANIFLKYQEEFMLKAIKEDIWCIEYARDNLRNDKNFILQAIEKQDFRCLTYSTNNLKYEKDFILRAIEKDYRSYAFINDKLKYDNDIVLKLRQVTR